MLVAGRLGGTRTRSEPPPVGRAAPCQVPGRVTRSPDAARRTARAPPIDRRSAPERRPGACRPGSAPLERARGAPAGSLPRPGSPAQRLPEGRSALHGVLPVPLHGRAAPLSALPVPAQGCVGVHVRLVAARQPLSNSPSASISASMYLRRPVRRPGSHPSAGPRRRSGTPGHPPPPPAQFPDPRRARGDP